jgi:hypothetical protein
MLFLTTAFNFLFLATSIQVLAAPLTFTDIERRWSAGESDVGTIHCCHHEGNSFSQRITQPNHSNILSSQASIHASHNPRSASPAWPLAARSAESEPSTTFAESYDAVTQQGLIGKRSNNNNNTALLARIRDFATRLLQSKGDTQMIAEREEVAPVLRPRKVVYRFTA